MSVDGQRHAPVSIVRACGSRGRPVRVRKISPPPRFESPTFQRIARCCADTEKYDCGKLRPGITNS
jgi:hypothetical protein